MHSLLSQSLARSLICYCLRIMNVYCIKFPYIKFFIYFFCSWIFITWWHCTNPLYVIYIVGGDDAYNSEMYVYNGFIRAGIYHYHKEIILCIKTYCAFTIDWIWMLLLLLIWKSIVDDDDGWKLLMLHTLPFDDASKEGAAAVSTFFGSLMGVNDSSPLESFSISAPNWWRAVIVDGVGSGML